MIKKFITEGSRDLHKWLPFLMFAVREVLQASLGFSPFELLYGRHPRGVLVIVREEWKTTATLSPLHPEAYVATLCAKFKQVAALAQQELMEPQAGQKRRHDLMVRSRVFQVGQKVLLLLPSSAKKLLVKWQGPFRVVAKTGEADYEIHMPEVGNKTFHVNLLKPWSGAPELEPAYDAFLGIELDFDWDKIRTEEIRAQMEKGIPLSAWQTQQIDQVLNEFPDMFSEVPGTAGGGGSPIA